MLFLAVCAPSYESSRSNFDSLRQNISNRIETDEQCIAVAFENLATGDTFLFNEKAMMHAASLMKVPVMIEVYGQAEGGAFSMNDSLPITNEFKSIVDGSPFSLTFDEDALESVYARLGQKMRIRDLAYFMIIESSNLATNILIEKVGAENVMQRMKAFHANDIRVLRGVEDLKAFHQGLNNTTTAFDMLLLMKAVARHEAISFAASEDMLKILADQTFKTKIPALLPAGTKVAHKTGHITAIDHDAAIITHPNGQQYVLVVLTKGFEQAEAEKHIAEISRNLFDLIDSTGIGYKR